ncbi:arginase family protein [Halomonas sp.]|uniref:arginase family protein n=1 Tax=unclassified Halomonas TaxID=2609666 RepID=UPI003F9016A7
MQFFGRAGIDRLDLAFAPCTGTPVCGGMSTDLLLKVDIKNYRPSWSSRRANFMVYFQSKALKNLFQKHDAKEILVHVSAFSFPKKILSKIRY